jgi:hypothetical protein
MLSDNRKAGNMFNKDAFSNGQIDSKLWLCEELEKLGWESDLTRIFGGWYGITAFLLLSRGKFQVRKIYSYDVDPSCEAIADMINENWVIKEWQFKAFTEDCNNPRLSQTTEYDSGILDLIINTSTEHFESMDWFDNIPTGTRVILQGNNMPHDDHIVRTTTLDEFIAHYPLSGIMYKGEKLFVYPEWQFTRYMIIGVK